MQQIDSFIDAAINRLSGPNATTISSFYVDLRSLQLRITQNLVDSCIQLCSTRGIYAQREGDGLRVTVNLDSCFMNPQQATMYNTALSFTRQVHGNLV